jgi:hypothetical protein
MRPEHRQDTGFANRSVRAHAKAQRRKEEAEILNHKGHEGHEEYEGNRNFPV